MQVPVIEAVSFNGSITTLKEALDCQVAGAAKQFIPPVEFKDQLSAVLNVTDICNGELWKVLRILRKGKIYHSEEYTRVKKRNSYTVLL